MNNILIDATLPHLPLRTQSCRGTFKAAQDSRAGYANEFADELLETALLDAEALEASMVYPLGVDVSRHQGRMDWPKCAAQGVTFAAIRATVGNYYTDPQFALNWQNAKAAGILVTAYHVVTPDIDAGAQMARLKSVIGEDHWFDLPLVLDCELTRGKIPSDISENINNCADIAMDWGMARPIIYTRQDWWDNHTLPSPHWKLYDLWVASYTSAPQPTLPRDWSDWLIWQYTSKGDGPKYGASSKSIDLNRFNGTLPGVEPPEPPEPEPTEYPMQIRTNTPGARLYVRTAPTIKDATAIGLVRNGTVFNATGESDDGEWLLVETYVSKEFTEVL